MKRAVLLPTVLALGLAGLWPPAAVATGAPSGDRDDLPRFGPGATYAPDIDASDFTGVIDNPWFPMIPGTTLVYSGSKDGKHARDVVTVTATTKVIDGVATRAVLDRLYLNGTLAERTFDYYAQDEDGNVWYFGEDTVARDDQGNLTDTEGSFRAGVDGAQPGVVMQAHPQLGRRFRQEWFRGQAEDQYRAVERDASVTVPYRAFARTLRTEESTALEPGVLDNKYYALGIGEVKEVTVKGPVEVLELTDVRTT